MKSSVKYTKLVIFAIIAIVSNLLGQELSLSVYSQQYSILLSIFIGTGTGLVVKYWLDKTFLFSYQTSSVQHEGKTFILYTLMGVVTTCIFWLTELSFEWIFQDKTMRYVGAVLGLTLGYYIKYILDGKFVFVEEKND